MKIMYNVKSTRGQYESEKYFTYGKVYNVLADYRKRNSRQRFRDNGFVIIDNTGQHNMLFMDQVTVTDNNIENTFVFEYMMEV